MNHHLNSTKVARIKTEKFTETIEQKGLRYFKLGRVKLQSVSSFDASFLILNTEVILILKTLEFKCMNKYCSFFRAGKEYPTCYHTFAVQSWILNNKQIILNWKSGCGLKPTTR